MAPPSKPVGPAPSRTQLHDAALRHLSRFATTEAGLVRVLERRVQRWARVADAQGSDLEWSISQSCLDARSVAAALVASGAVNDASFAAARAARLMRGGRSRAAVAAHLVAKGVQPDLARAVLPEQEQELQAALALARRRHLGPFRTKTDTNARLNDLGALARAGFGRDVAERALDMSAEEAEGLVMALRRG